MFLNGSNGALTARGREFIEAAILSKAPPSSIYVDLERRGLGRQLFGACSLFCWYSAAVRELADDKVSILVIDLGLTNLFSHRFDASTKSL